MVRCGKECWTSNVLLCVDKEWTCTCLVNRSINEMYGKFDEGLIHDVENEEMMEPVYKDDNDDKEKKIDNDEMKDDSITGPKPLVNAEIYLSHGDWMEITKVIGRKQNIDGNFVGCKHKNPVLDSRVFIVEYSDGEQREVLYNILSENLFSQIDKEGNQYRLFKCIVNHRKSQRAVDKANQYCVINGQKYMKKTTAGWDLEVEWKHGSTSWLPLKEMN
jgi:hypothetical protein